MTGNGRVQDDPPSTVLDLTPRQKEILGVIMDKVVQCGYPPSVREIMAMTGIESTRGVTCHLDALARKGYIARGLWAREIMVRRDVDGRRVGLMWAGKEDLKDGQ